MMPETGPKALRHLRGLDPETFAAIWAETEAREAQRRAREAASPAVPSSPSPRPSDPAREWAEAVADGFRDLARRLRELAAGDGSG